MSNDGSNVIQYQFKKGQSGNPAGKPKKGEVKKEDIRTQLKRMLEREVECKNLISGETEIITFKELLERSVVGLVGGKSERMIEMLWDRIHGKVPQKLDIEDSSNPLAGVSPDELKNLAKLAKGK